MKKLALILFLLFPLIALGQEDVINGILGIPFGTPYDTVYFELKNNLRTKKIRTSKDRLIILCEDVQHLGLNYSVLCLRFKYKKTIRKEAIPGFRIENGDTIYESMELDIPQFIPLLDRADFILLCDTENEVEQMLMQIKRTMGYKYKLNPIWGDPFDLDFVKRNDSYYGGTSPLNANLRGFSIYISYSAPLFAEQHPYSAILQYGPYGFGNDN